MKARERIRRIRKSKSWTERHQLALDVLPGTKFDGLLAQLIQALPYAKAENKGHYTDKGFDIEGMARDVIFAFGLDLVKAVKAGNSKLFFDLGEAVNTCHGYKPDTDKERQVLVEFCIPPNKGFSIEQLLVHFKSKKLPVNEYTPRKIYRLCKDLSIKIKGRPGRRWLTSK